MKTTLLLFTAQPSAGLFSHQGLTQLVFLLFASYFSDGKCISWLFTKWQFWALSAFCPNSALSTSLFSSLSAVLSFLWTHSINPGASCPSCIWDVYRPLPYTHQSLPPDTDFHLFPSPSLVGHVERSLAPLYRRGNQGSAKGSEWPSLQSWWACTAGMSTLISWL